MTDPLRVLITGATGFIGRHLTARMIAGDRHVSLAVNRTRIEIDGVRAVHVVGDLGSDTVPPAPFEEIDVLVHLAGHVATRAEGLVEDSHNVRMARVVAGRARDAGVPRVLVLSSIAATVVVETPELARRYGEEKLAADRVIGEMLGPEQRAVYIRPPAVYGPGMSGSLATLARLIAKGFPVPLGLARAPRNYISVGNLTDLLDTVAGAPEHAWEAASGRAFAPSDGDPVATDALVRMIGQAQGRRARLLPVPLGVLRLMGRLSGRAEMISGAIDGLELANNERLNEIFGWTPHERMPESLAFLAP